MKALRIALGTVLLIQALGGFTIAYADTASSLHVALTGSLMKTLPGQPVVPVVAADVYLHPVQSTDANKWIGPDLTDGAGKFTFLNIPAGSYLMRVYSGSIRVWEQTVSVPGALPPIVVTDVRVVYYPKKSDGALVDSTLQKLQLPYSTAETSVAVATNTVWFGDRVPVAVVKSLCKSLIAAGVPLRAIRRFAVGNDWRAKVIEVGGSPQHTTGRTLTAADVDHASDFPRAR